ncbi:MAG: hypothetical protein WHT29_03030 [Bacteroidales bacterium]
MKNLFIFSLLLLLLKTVNGQTSTDSLSPIFLKSNIGFLIGNVESEMKAPFSFMSDFNIKVSKNVHVGMGTGIEFFQTTYVPVYLATYLKPFARNVVFSVAGGYTFPLNRRVTFNDGYDYKFYEGYFVNPEISYIFHSTANQHAFMIGIGYRYQRTSAKRLERENIDWNYYPYYDYMLITVLNRFSLRIGYLFF